MTKTAGLFEDADELFQIVATIDDAGVEEGAGLGGLAGGASVLASRAGKGGRPQGPARGGTRPTGLVQEFGRAFQGKLSTDNSPAFQGREPCKPKVPVPAGTAEEWWPCASTCLLYTSPSPRDS